MFSMKGVDISHWNGDIDFNELKKVCDFVIIKIGGSDGLLGVRYKDIRFDDYYKKAKAVGLHIGCYFFCGKNNTSTDAINDAKYWLNLMRGYTFDMPIYADYEVNSAKTKTANTEYLRTLCQYMEDANYYVGIYASDISGFHDKLDKTKLLPFTWWVARYSKNKPTYAKENLHMWQYSSKGTISGCKHAIDLDECYINFPSIIKKKGLNIYGRRKE